MDNIDNFDFEEATDIFLEDDDYKKIYDDTNSPNVSPEDNFKNAWNTLGDSQAGNMKQRADKALIDLDAGVNKTYNAINKTFGTSAPQTIFQGARKSLVQFPIYTSASIDITTASLLAKYLEIYYAAIFQQMLSLNQYISIDQANNLSFLSTMHTNIKECVDAINSKEYGNYLRNPFYQPINEMDEMIQNGFSNEIHLTENTSLIFRMVPSDDEDMNFESRRMSRNPFEGLTYLKEDNINDPNNFSTAGQNIETNTKKVILKNEDFERMANNLRSAGNGNSVDQIIDDIKADIRNGRMPGYQYLNGEYYRRDSTQNTKINMINTSTQKPIEGPKPPQILKDNEIRKINELAPYRMSVTFRVALPNGGVDRDISFIIGVKSLLRPIDASDIADDLYEIVTGQSSTLQKVRYKTGEISLTDYLFDVKGLKKDAVRNLNYNQKWVTTLKRLADGSKLGNTFLQPAVDLLQGGEIPIPNATIIFTDADVNYLKGVSGVDLNNLQNAAALCKSLFLVSFIIITPATSTMKILTPTNFGDWQYQSLKTVQDEVNKAENSDLNRAIQKAINN